MSARTHRATLKARKQKQRVIAGEREAVIVTVRTKRRVLLIADGYLGKDRARACVHLDDAACIRLANRLIAIAGGYRTIR